MKTVMETFMVGENQEIFPRFKDAVSDLHDSRNEAFGW
jgi:hypothetical protein